MLGAPRGSLLQGKEFAERCTPPPLDSTPKKSALKRTSLHLAVVSITTPSNAGGISLTNHVSARVSEDDGEPTDETRVLRKLSWHDHHGARLHSFSGHQKELSTSRILCLTQSWACPTPGLELIQVHNVYDTYYQRGPCSRWKHAIRMLGFALGLLLLCFAVSNFSVRVLPTLIAGQRHHPRNYTLRSPLG